MKLELKNLTKNFDRPVLRGIDLEDEVGSVALIGRSGCGKSTLLRILGGLLPADEGAAVLDGRPAADDRDYRKDIGFVFQQGGLFSHLSAMENITLPLTQVHGMSAGEAAGRAGELLERFGLLDQADKLPAQLSGGQRQRISIARALAPRPKVLLLDEPTSALDPEYTSEVLSMVEELRQAGLSFIIATHEMGFALHSCDKVAFMNDGVIAEYGDSGDVFRNPRTPELRAFLSKLLQWQV